MPRSQFVFTSLATLAMALALGQSSNGQTLTTLASFNDTDGQQPWGTLTLLGSTLYGTTELGGADHGGAVISIPVTGGTPTVVGSFNGINGAYPLGNVTPSSSGSTLYGTTYQYGATGDGVVFSVPTAGGNPTILTSFYGPNGEDPYGSLTLSSSGSTLYGMTAFGGADGGGVIFSLPVTGGTDTILHSFTGGTNLPDPFGSLTLGGSTLYGMTYEGGSFGIGTIFSISTSGGAFTTLASFNGTDGRTPDGDVTLIGSTLYGMTATGGANNDGTIFSIPVTGGTPNVLVSFNGTDGANPYGDLTLIGSTFYGMTQNGGANGDGTIFSVPMTGGTPTTLVSFDGDNGANPRGNLTPDGSTLFGMTEFGGANDYGTIFALALVPEPSSVVLFGFGAIGLAAAARRRAARKRAA